MSFLISSYPSLVRLLLVNFVLCILFHSDIIYSFVFSSLPFLRHVSSASVCACFVVICPSVSSLARTSDTWKEMKKGAKSRSVTN